MNRKLTTAQLSIALILGSVWGVGEVMLGVGLKSCAQLMSGSIMTGVGLFFIAASWAATRTYLVPVILVLVASVLKLLDAALLGLPVMSGAIGNPIFAFMLEGLAFVALILIFKKTNFANIKSSALLGAGSAFIAVLMFPLVKFATGVPACLAPNTAIPLSIAFGPIAIAFSALTVPLGMAAERWFEGYYRTLAMRISNGIVRFLVYPATIGTCILVLIVFRMIVTT